MVGINNTTFFITLSSKFERGSILTGDYTTKDTKRINLVVHNFIGEIPSFGVTNKRHLVQLEEDLEIEIIHFNFLRKYGFI